MRKRVQNKENLDAHDNEEWFREKRRMDLFLCYKIIFLNSSDDDNVDDIVNLASFVKQKHQINDNKKW